MVWEGRKWEAKAEWHALKVEGGGGRSTWQRDAWAEETRRAGEREGEGGRHPEARAGGERHPEARERERGRRAGPGSEEERGSGAGPAPGSEGRTERHPEARDEHKINTLDSYISLTYLSLVFDFLSVWCPG